MPIAPVECLDELRLVVAATKHFDGIAVKLSRASKGERRYEGGTVCLLQVVEGEAICGMHQKDQVFAYDSDPLNIILITLVVASIAYSFWNNLLARKDTPAGETAPEEAK